MNELTLEELKQRIYNRPDNIQYLRQFFGNATTEPDMTAGKQLTRENLLAYRVLAMRIVDAGKDSTGVQAKRIQQVDLYLRDNLVQE